MKYDNQLRIAVNIVKEYDGRYPLAAWLKEYFRQNKQMGSKDRKTVSSLVYSYYRLGRVSFNSIEERILAGIALCKVLPEWVDYFKPVVPIVLPTAIFPWRDALSDDIDADQFALSFLQQPDLFLRIRPGYEKIVYGKLNAANISYQALDDSCIALPNTTKVDEVLAIDKEVVIQDMSSQKTGSLLNGMADGRLTVWDCCAASGGKSIMAFDKLHNIDLTVSDIRDSIIRNLRTRFDRAGIKSYTSFVADIGAEDFKAPTSKYDLIIADVPCSGSGTWSRTPEQVSFFKEEKIEYYSELQKRIVSNVLPALKPGGKLLYITCSVFKEENEGVIQYIQEKFPLDVKQMRIIKGYKDKADTMFAALLAYKD